MLRHAKEWRPRPTAAAGADWLATKRRRTARCCCCCLPSPKDIPSLRTPCARAERPRRSRRAGREGSGSRRAQSSLSSSLSPERSVSLRFLQRWTPPKITLDVGESSCSLRRRRRHPLFPPSSYLVPPSPLFSSCGCCAVAVPPEAKQQQRARKKSPQ